MFQPEIAFFSQNRGGTSAHTHTWGRGSPGKSTQGGRAGGSGNRGATVTGASCRRPSVPPTPPRAALAWLKSLASANGKCCQILKQIFAKKNEDYEKYLVALCGFLKIVKIVKKKKAYLSKSSTLYEV